MESNNLVYKEKFIERYSNLTEWKVFEEINKLPLRKSIRVNTLKISIEELKKRLKNYKLTQVPWCKEGFWIEQEKGEAVGNLLEHQLGYFYIQEAASMIPPIVLNPEPSDVVVDLCAAPGSKTTQLAQFMQNKGIIIANDVTGDRLGSLGANAQRLGITSIAITKSSAERLTGKYNKILLDAPCSSTGTIRKSPRTVKTWNPDLIRRLQKLQKKLIMHAYNNLLTEGGTMVYSTCSVEPEEDEEVVNYLLMNTNAEIEEIKLDIKRTPAVLEFEDKKYSEEIKKCLRLWPQDNDTEGFFVCKIKKPN
ncbi:RsmB/NOP family class I SAM-dependent RNA methyltransferase [Candidatus Woesearchaeota archaeon]|nr:RsmB/NOP family class I SAM-dependent RNA methyltransferase [Candidatus Woesearchaeota archaeon]